MRTLLALLAAASLAPHVAAAAPYDPYGYRGGRDSWYVGFGLGSGGGSYVLDGQRVNYRNHHGDASPFHFAWQVEAGATVTPRLLVGGEVSGLVSTASGFDRTFGDVSSTLTVTQLLAVATYFPLERGPFLRAGAGFAWITSQFDDAFGAVVEDTASGVGALGGVGYAWWLGRRFNLTLHADVSGQWYGGGHDHPSSSAGVNGYLGFRWY